MRHGRHRAATVLTCTQREYRGSDEEKKDLLRHYEQLQGNMARVFDMVMVSRPELDSHRFMDIIDAAIQAGETR